MSAAREQAHQLAGLEVSNGNASVVAPERSLDKFVSSLSIAWKTGEVRPTRRKPQTGSRPWRTRVDPFESTWPLVEQWLNEQPDANAKALFDRLQQQFRRISCEPFSGASAIGERPRLDVWSQGHPI
jgi:hypothetical protein